MFTVVIVDLWGEVSKVVRMFDTVEIRVQARKRGRIKEMTSVSYH